MFIVKLKRKILKVYVHYHLIEYMDIMFEIEITRIITSIGLDLKNQKFSIFSSIFNCQFYMTLCSVIK